MQSIAGIGIVVCVALFIWSVYPRHKNDPITWILLSIVALALLAGAAVILLSIEGKL